MTDRPILFSAPMVRALLAGTKTQTRRTTKLDIINESPSMWEAPQWKSGAWWCKSLFKRKDYLTDALLKCPYGQPGDRLWVRENAYIAPSDFGRGGNLKDHTGNHRAVSWSASMDGDAVRCAKDYGVKQTPSIHMPRWASRITLEITDVRVERLQDISEEDARAEGIRWTVGGPLHAHIGLSHVDMDECNFPTAKAAYEALWNDINGPGSWDLNPWVWAVSFKVVRP